MVLLIQTGGTIDKRYPRSTLGYAFEICESAAATILDRIHADYKLIIACKKDSTELLLTDREKIVDIIQTQTFASKINLENKRIIITHGTDTMSETGIHLLKAGLGLTHTIVITGSSLSHYDIYLD